MTISEASARIHSGALTCVALAEQCLEKIEALNPKLNAFITVTADAARNRARELDHELAAGRDRGRLHGIPIAHKDLVFTRGIRTTCGSLLFQDFVPAYNAAVVDRLEEAGAVLVGKTGLHELAYGITSENPHFGVIRNPHDPERVPGGSSGGAGVAIATGMALLATGTDTGGSIRIPASFCGIVGLKPTYGLVDTTGIQPLGLSLDHCGPMAATVRDAAWALSAMCGRSYDVPAEAAAERPLSGLRIGVPSNFFFEEIAPEVAEAVQASAKRAAALGASIHAIEVPDIEALNAAGRIILLAEASAIYRRHLHRRELFGSDVFALLHQGLMVPGADYVDAQRVRRVITAQFRALFLKVDCIFAPATATVAPRIGEREIFMGGKLTDVRLATTRVVRGINMLGLPALALPCGTSPEGLPIGLQIIADAFREDVLLRAGAALESR
ncbi:MAG TPA: amidase [Bryobacteraceae bacterium]|nr:amidase [Bryobacteraceae bacterium]